jgi:hypothetical protein
MDVKTVVKTAEGDVKEFGDYLSKFVVSHPKTACIVCFVVGWLVNCIF